MLWVYLITSCSFVECSVAFLELWWVHLLDFASCFLNWLIVLCLKDYYLFVCLDVLAFVILYEELMFG